MNMETPREKRLRAAPEHVELPLRLSEFSTPQLAARFTKIIDLLREKLPNEAPLFNLRMQSARGIDLDEVEIDDRQYTRLSLLPTSRFITDGTFSIGLHLPDSEGRSPDLKLSSADFAKILRQWKRTGLHLSITPADEHVRKLLSADE